MSNPAPSAREAVIDELRITVPALGLAALGFFLLGYTGLSVGLRMGATFFAYVVLQALFWEMTKRQRLGWLGWAFATIVATIMGATMWYLGDI